jgi:hypothetical protein
MAGLRFSMRGGAEMVEQLRELMRLLEAKEYQSRMEGIGRLLEYCRTKPELITTNLVEVNTAHLPSCLSLPCGCNFNLENPGLGWKLCRSLREQGGLRPSFPVGL